MGEPIDMDDENYRAVQIREVPGKVVDILQARATAGGMSLTAFLRNHLVEMASKPTMAELYERASKRDWGVDRQTIVDTIREIRDGDG